MEAVRAKVEWELDFSNWAPRSSRAWRLRELPPDLVVRDRDKEADDGPESTLAAATAAQLALLREGDGEAGGALTGDELRNLCLAKFGRAYDMAIKQVDVSSGNIDRFVSLNLYAGFLGQRSFPYSEEVFIEKLDSVALMLSAWGQADYVRAWFATPPTPRGGLPSTPRVDTAVSIRLNCSPTWDPRLVEQWFSS